jgi:hypothetical protein
MIAENRYYTLILSLAVLLCTSCQKEMSEDLPGTATVQIRFHPMINGTPFTLNTAYTNPFGEPFTASAFKFYTGLFTFRKEGGTEVAAEGEPYYLIDASDQASMTISATIRAGIYDGISFLLGVDSARNVSGVQSGALDPARGMFWTWNSGYIYIKMEGTSPVSTLVNNVFEYHVGGFRWPNSAIRTFAAASDIAGEWQLGEGRELVVDVAVDIEHLFNHSIPVRISEKPVCMSPGELARDISANFAGAIRIMQAEVK